MAEKTVKMKTSDGSVIKVAEPFIDVFLGCGYTLFEEKKPAVNTKKAEKTAEK